jgi:hypothetical protein
MLKLKDNKDTVSIQHSSTREKEEVQGCSFVVPDAEALDKSIVSSNSLAKAPSFACKALTLDLWFPNDAIVYSAQFEVIRLSIREYSSSFFSYNNECPLSFVGIGIGITQASAHRGFE